MNDAATQERATSGRRMSDNELRKAIRVLQSRADDARRRGAEDDASRIERTVREYQDEMTTRL
ncbi:hypothetical protein ASG56_03530 [Rhodococcus sp. Leaf7]|jgi:hypothetical protein|uniref:hypothetical protein n=1 Tax=unclassified Rhodococcus (in: high G+C Gram-positive bacteria) TaxID=192944 RepID=UPI0005AC44E2|nr:MULTISPECIES: hypothetical protein [unclassified Rhodococcus (in: high G+C Gram-positive bacteria)]KIQ17079.1 hypothetical protein RU01_11920 [Rhodococcus sp. MEB064]KQU06714.1 hypothetical protein ASG56_03530 [Rhodococcus sp. Leaf7]KQU42233.1 hypothetical protein ASG64_03530 [Rhodococcus sp. Leaf247]